jgi:IS5 family transposase
MRRLFNQQKMLEFNPGNKKVRAELEMMDKVLKSREGILELVAKDIQGEADGDTGRPGMSADQVLRMAIVKQRYQLSYEELSDQVSDSVNLRRFCGYEWGEVPQASALQDNIKRLTAKTLEAVNDALVAYAQQQGLENGKKVRIDTLAVETNIHYPTDARLIEDAIRVITRMLGRARSTLPQAGLTFHDHTRVAAKRVLAIANSRGAEERKQLYGDLLKYAIEVVQEARENARKLRKTKGTEEEQELGRLMADDLEAVATKLERIIDQTTRRVMKGESVPASEKIVSIFEDHTDIIEKGGRETVFGHKVCVSTGLRLVLDAIMPRGNPADSSLYCEAIDRVRAKNGGKPPEMAAADGGFASQANEDYARSLGIDKVFFGKSVRRGVKSLLSDWQRKSLRAFRAGIEGILSTLKRVRGFTRCLWEGWESFQSFLWASIVSENLVRIARDMTAREAAPQRSG